MTLEVLNTVEVDYLVNIANVLSDQDGVVHEEDFILEGVLKDVTTGHKVP